jgi:pyruvate-formate lyase
LKTTPSQAARNPLIMGKDNGNTTNSWLNLAKILELTIQGGVSQISGKKLGLGYHELGYTGSDGCKGCAGEYP